VFKEFTERKFKELMQQENLNEIFKLRERAIEMRH